jgi:hypothetical protein
MRRNQSFALPALDEKKGENTFALALNYSEYVAISYSVDEQWISNDVRNSPLIYDDLLHDDVPILYVRFSMTYEDGIRGHYDACGGSVDMFFSLYSSFLQNLNSKSKDFQPNSEIYFLKIVFFMFLSLPISNKKQPRSRKNRAVLLCRFSFGKENVDYFTIRTGTVFVK